MRLAEKRQLALDLALATLVDLAPARLIAAQVRRQGSRLLLPTRAWDLSRNAEILVLAYGKAAVPMAQAAETLLRPRPPAAAPWPRLRLCISAPDAFLAPGQATAPWSDVRQFVGGHPEPNAASVAAAHAMLQACAAAPPASLILHLVSGGGSALAEAPILPALSLSALQAAYRALVRNGAPIHEINAVRKHFSAFKGGRLAAAAPPSADQLSLILSDVPAGDLSSVASGPSAPDPTTRADCARILAAHPTDLPAPVVACLRAGQLPETPKPGDPSFARAAWHLLMDDRGAAAALAAKVGAAGLAPVLDHTADEWDYAAAAAHLLRRIRELRRRQPNACLIASGEVRVAVRGAAGRGGRNQTFALECARQIAGEDLCVLSLGTDGVDGNSPAAGALVDGDTLARAAALGLDLDAALAHFDAYPLLAALRDSIEIGPTGTNLRDLRIFL